MQGQIDALKKAASGIDPDTAFIVSKCAT